MTYGWAILVVLIAIGALAYFGVLNPSKFLPDQCVLFAGVTCLNYFADDSQESIQFDVVNGLGETISSVAITPIVSGKTFTPNTALVPGSVDCSSVASIPDGGAVTCVWTTAPAIALGNKLKGQITMAYTLNNQARTRTGSFAFNVEP